MQLAVLTLSKPSNTASMTNGSTVPHMMQAEVYKVGYKVVLPKTVSSECNQAFRSNFQFKKQRVS